MNKKYLTFGLLSLLFLSFATAGLISYYATVEQTITVESPVGLQGNTTTEDVAVYAGASFSGDLITVTNNAPFTINVSITNDAPEGISVDYVNTLQLSKKIVDFENSPWNLTGDFINISYTLVGDSFSASAEVPIAGYELVYYKDNSDRFSNPATAISISNITGNLPYANDGNAEEYDMCEIEGYTNCNGAKIWYVPSDAVSGGVINWSRASEFYFETNLIQYNSNGDIIVYDSLDVTPVYDVSENYVGEDIITTTIA